MSAISRPRRGRPLLFLAMLLSGWTMLRVATWENPWPDAAVPDWVAPVAERLLASADAPEMADPEEPKAHNRFAEPYMVQRGWRAEVLPENDVAAPARAAFAENRTLVGHNLLLMAAMSRLPMPASVAALIDEARPAIAGPAAAPASEGAGRRWHFDGWLLLREGASGGLAGGARAPAYGASQAGAVLAYDLARTSALRPAIYLRASSALREPRGSEAALGLRARPLASLPLLLHAELRATDRERGAELRPAAFATVGFERKDLPLGLMATGYAQAGYVGGDDATGFVDGHLVVDRALASFDLGTLRAGAGAWGGAQQGSSRLDVGPSASLEFPIADVPARLAVDYRIRVAGNAEPDSGAALTLTTGF